LKVYSVWDPERSEDMYFARKPDAIHHAKNVKAKHYYEIKLVEGLTQKDLVVAILNDQFVLEQTLLDVGGRNAVIA